MIPALVAVVVVALAAVYVIVRLTANHQRQVADLIAEQQSERAAWARERWDLNTRLQHPELVPAVPTAGVPTETPDPDPDDVDEDHLVGTVA